MHIHTYICLTLWKSIEISFTDVYKSHPEGPAFPRALRGIAGEQEALAFERWGRGGESVILVALIKFAGCKACTGVW